MWEVLLREKGGGRLASRDRNSKREGRERVSEREKEEEEEEKK